MAPERHARRIWLSLAVVAFDRATKFAIERYTAEDLHHILLPGLVTLVHSRNPGIAFSLLANSPSRWLSAALIVGSLAIIAVLAYVLVTPRAMGARAAAGLALIAGGATGNLIDRLLYGGVTDFFEVHVGNFHWPAFNVADSAITIGALLIVLEMWRGQRHSTVSA